MDTTVENLPHHTSDVYDAHPEVAGSCDLQMRNLGGRARFAGEVVTLEAFEDNLLVKQILARPGAGKVLVVDAGGTTHGAMMGGNMAATAASNGWEGVVVNGAVRDSHELAECDLGVKALGTNPRRSLKAGAGREGVPVGFGGVVFTPGDLLVSDDDGIIVLPATAR